MGNTTEAARRPETASSARKARVRRVGMVVFSYYPADPRPRRAAEALVKEGMEVDVVCLGGIKGVPKRETVNGVDVLRVPLTRQRGGALRYMFQYLAFLLSTMAVLGFRSLTRRYDLVHVHNMPDFLVFSALVPKALGAKVILDLHDPMPELMMAIFNLHQDSLPVRTLRRLERLSIRLADLVLTVNLACKRLFTARSCRPEKITVVMNSPDEDIFGFEPISPDIAVRRTQRKPFVLMYHGSMVERNGLGLAIEALARIRESIPSVELRIYGPENPFLVRVMETVAAKGLSDVVRYLGPRRLEDIVAAIADCDVGIIPPEPNVFAPITTPTRIFEYLALGKPVIVPRVPGIQDYFSEDSLIFFELGNAEDLARQVEFVYAQSAEVVEIVKRGQGVYSTHVWHEERKTLVNVTCELLNDGVAAA
jgi:glycosyltransferase involved in cell wall biosynthesis